MSYRYLLTLLGLTLILVGVVKGGWFLVAIWLGADFLILGIAHARNAPGILGKRPDGSLAWWSWLVFLPLHLYTVVLWHVVRWLSREQAFNVVANELVVGRRLLHFEKDGEFDNYVDLTAEFSEPPAIRTSASYRSFPILDGAAPKLEALRTTVEGLRPGRTFIHCAQGHGRTGLFALAVMLSSGEVRSVDDGVQRLRRIRPGIQLNADQLACIREYGKQIL